MQIGARQFTPDIKVCFAYVIVLAALLSLGFWQWGRAGEKQATIDLAASASATQASAIDQVTEAHLLAGPVQVALSGSWKPQWQFLWDNRVHSGQAGFEAISVIITDTDQAILVNRGWVPLGRSRADLPDVMLDVSDADDKWVLEGLLTRPSKGLVGGVAVHDQASWPMLLQYFDYELIGQLIGREVVPAVLQLNGASQQSLGEKMYVANWQPVAGLPPMRHIGYSVQWFAMAFMLTVLFIFYNVKKIEE
jgi:surfeit locus 1 family protein